MLDFAAVGRCCGLWARYPSPPAAFSKVLFLRVSNSYEFTVGPFLLRIDLEPHSSSPLAGRAKLPYVAWKATLHSLWGGPLTTGCSAQETQNHSLQAKITKFALYILLIPYRPTLEPILQKQTGDGGQKVQPAGLTTFVWNGSLLSLILCMYCSVLQIQEKQTKICHQHPGKVCCTYLNPAASKHYQTLSSTTVIDRGTIMALQSVA